MIREYPTLLRQRQAYSKLEINSGRSCANGPKIISKLFDNMGEVGCCSSIFNKDVFCNTYRSSNDYINIKDALIVQYRDTSLLFDKRLCARRRRSCAYRYNDPVMSPTSKKPAHWERERSWSTIQKMLDEMYYIIMFVSLSETLTTQMKAYHVFLWRHPSVRLKTWMQNVFSGQK